MGEIKMETEKIVEPVVQCDDCGKLYLKFKHLPTLQPCPHCEEGEIG